MFDVMLLQVRLSKLDSFFKDIKKSTSRQVILLNITQTAGDGEVEAGLREVASMLLAQERSLVAEPGPGKQRVR